MYPLLIALLATAAHGQFLPDADPDSLNMERVGQIRLLSAPGAEPFLAVTDLYLAADYAYLGSYDNLVYVVDIADPTDLREVARINTPGTALDIKVADDLAVIGVQDRESDFGLVVVDISDPTAPVELAQLVREGWHGVHNLFLYGNRAYLAHAGSRGMTIVDLTDPRKPAVSGFWLNSGKFNNVVHDVFARDGLAFVSHIAADAGGLAILDLADPDNPITLSSLSFPEGIHSAWAAGHYVYCNQEFGGWERPLYVVDIADPRKPELVHTFRAQPPPDDQIVGPHNPWVQNGLLYWAYYDGGVRIFDLFDPAHPREIAYHSAPGFAWGVQPHRNGIVYAADGAVGLVAFRLSTPSHAIRRVITLPNVAVRGRHATLALQVHTKRFATDAVGTVQRVSARLITGEQAPERLLIANGELFTGELPIPAELPTGRHRLHVELEDDRGQIYPFDQPYDLFPDRDLEIYSESLAEGWLRTGNVPRETTLFAGRQALTLPNRFTTTFQVRTPFDPTGYAALRFAFHPDAVEGFASNALAVTVDQHTLRLSFRGGDSLAVSLEDKRWQLVEIPLETLGLPGSNPPPVFRSVRISGSLRGTSHIADLALVAAAPPANTAVRETREDALPAIFTLAQNFPNPFNAATTIRFELPERADVELALYNLAGQRIATLATGKRPAGTYTLTWDGRDDSGRALASGLYLYCLRSGQTTETRKLTLLR